MVSKIAIDNLMLAVIGAMGIVYLANMLYPELYPLLTFNRELILSGQVWRTLTFLFLSTETNILYFLLFGYFYWWIGSSLEDYWGKTKFCAYYYLGALLLVVSGFIVGTTTSAFLNLSLFFAFAALDPNHEILLFFILPVKIKWIAWLNAAYFVYMFIIGGLHIRVAIIASFLNFFIFFSEDIIRRIRIFIWDMKYRMRRK